MKCHDLPCSKSARRVDHRIESTLIHQLDFDYLSFWEYDRGVDLLSPCSNYSLWAVRCFVSVWIRSIWMPFIWNVNTFCAVNCCATFFLPYIIKQFALNSFTVTPSDKMDGTSFRKYLFNGFLQNFGGYFFEWFFFELRFFFVAFLLSEYRFAR